MTGAVRVFAVCAVAGQCLMGAEVVHSVSWDSVPDTAVRSAGTTTDVSIEVDSTHGSVLCVSKRTGDPGVVVLWRGTAPRISTSRYVVRGQVRYEGVEPGGYLELLSTLSDGASYFTRTQAERGPLALLAAESNWRPFALPFQCSPGSSSLSELSVALHLPGAGRVWVGPLTVAELQAGDPVLGGGQGWWGPRAGGLLGGILGGLCGLAGAAIGILCALGRARSQVFGLAYAVVGVGALLVVTGLVGVVFGQPFHVWFPVLLTGAVAGLVFGVNVRTIRASYEQRDLQRMKAQDVSAE